MHKGTVYALLAAIMKSIHLSHTQWERSGRTVSTQDRETTPFSLWAVET